MIKKNKHSGLTLIETVVVIVVIASIAALSLPVLRSFIGSMASTDGARTMIAAAISASRAIAIREQSYAGLRFQNDRQGNQYIIFIINDYDVTGLVYGFKAVDRQKPHKLSEHIAVMDLMVRTNHGDADNPDNKPIEQGDLDDSISANIYDGVNRNITDATTFSIIFTPAGKLVIHNVRVRNKDAVYLPENDGGAAKVSTDDIFNSEYNIGKYNIGMFIQDDYAQAGLGKEPSRNNFVIYDKRLFQKMNAAERYDYLKNQLDRININAYTGKIISTDF